MSAGKYNPFSERSSLFVPYLKMLYPGTLRFLFQTLSPISKHKCSFKVGGATCYTDGFYFQPSTYSKQRNRVQVRRSTFLMTFMCQALKDARNLALNKTK